MSQFFLFFFFGGGVQRGGASWLRVCYQQGLPLLVFGEGNRLIVEEVILKISQIRKEPIVSPYFHSICPQGLFTLLSVISVQMFLCCPEGGGVYLTVYHESSPNTDMISF